MSNRQPLPQPRIFACPGCGRELIALSYSQALPAHPRRSRVHPDRKCPGCGQRYDSHDLARNEPLIAAAS